jgi:hypothetical protein
MAITYTFIPTKVEIAPSLDGLEKVITRVRYDYKGVNEDGIEGVFAGVTPMTAPTDSENFKPFEELQPEDIISWLEETADKTHMEQRIEKQISDQIVPKYVEVALPWEPITETPVFNQTSTTTQI